MSTTPGLTAFATADHRQCDQLWAQVEQFEDDPAAAIAAWQTFADAMERHFQMEEGVLFPAFEKASGMRGGGPTAMMRMEHTQMRGLMRTMAEHAQTGDIDLLLDHGDTLLMLIQQHNAKEENMLYPMSERAIGPAWPQMHATIRAQFWGE